MEPQFDRISVPSLVDECHRRIKEQILAGDLGPGAPLRDSVLAQAMGISRSPVREALRRLEQSGLVVKTANQSYRVRAVGADDVAELAALRIADEGLAVRIIVREKKPIDSLLGLIDEIRAAPAGSVEAADADAAFHSRVVALAGLPRLNARYADLTDQIRLMLVSRDPSPVVDQHALGRHHVVLYETLERAIESGEPDDALQAWEDHVRHVLPTRA
ncbi:GntR family transcriptional regulator [Amycolatopsis rhabdoformis]|uniref:GntR family transcriptional regulator n=1 Tax=Amycolatopsis rhabdoformis TaxID=1448059 RepID=A0ABZ1IGC0_9PSEU|nr:GntR family transcriptional regulator [Amycolatopsis rhabdoformis]WSE32485.1 GntR family transcriptional regulator [Amycolatopsis rhabdoformis]